MNIKMICAQMMRIALQHGFEYGDDLFRPRRRSSVAAPQFPRMQIRPQHQRDAPVSHRHVWIQFRRALETFFRLVVIEAVVKRHAMLERALSLGIAGLYGVMHSAKSGTGARARSAGGRRGMLMLRGGRAANQ